MNTLKGARTLQDVHKWTVYRLPAPQKHLVHLNWLNMHAITLWQKTFIEQWFVLSIIRKKIDWQRYILYPMTNIDFTDQNIHFVNLVCKIYRRSDDCKSCANIFLYENSQLAKTFSKSTKYLWNNGHSNVSLTLFL